MRRLMHTVIALPFMPARRASKCVTRSAAMRELWAALSEMQTMGARDPGIRVAGDDLYGAAAAMVEAQSAGSGVGVRHWRLLGEAEARLHDRMASARPREKAPPAGWN